MKIQFFLISLLISLHTSVFAETASTTVSKQTNEGISSLDAYEWSLVRDMDGIRVYMKHRDESKIKSFLAKSVMDAPDPYSLAAVIEDFKAAPEWMHMMSEVTELKRVSDSVRDVRLETRLPWPVLDRDVAAHAVVTQNPKNYDITITMIQDNSLLPEYPGYIRMPEFKGIIRAKMISNQRMEMEMEFLLDSGGYIPPWVSNIILKDISFYTLKKLRKMILKEKYQNQKSVYESWLSMPDNYFTSDYRHPDEAKVLKKAP